MQVNIFVTLEDSAPADFLVLPFSSHSGISQAGAENWKYYATVDSQDGIFGEIDGRAIEIEIEKSGHALVKTRLTS